MIVFKPRLALFYFVALVIISLVTKRLTITSQVAMADTAVENVSECAQKSAVEQIQTSASAAVCSTPKK